MAYTKPVKTVTDHAWGYQSANIIAGNQQAQYDAYSLEHGTDEPQLNKGFAPIRPPANKAVGHHNAERIARDVLAVRVQYSGQFVAPLVYVSSSNFVVGASRIAQGQFKFDIRGLVTFWGEVAPNYSTASSVVLPTVRSYYPTGPGSPPSILVTMQLISGGTFTNTDIGFTLTISGTV